MPGSIQAHTSLFPNHRPIPHYTSTPPNTMDSPLHIGDSTDNSISHQLGGTHLHIASSDAVVPHAVSSAHYQGQKFLQLSVDVGTPPTTVHVLRRVQDSYVNVSQMLDILVLLSLVSADAVDAYLANNVVSSTRYMPQGGVTAPVFNDLRADKSPVLRGLWVPFDRAVAIAVHFDLYAAVKRLLLVDVHDYDTLPPAEAPAKVRARAAPADDSPTRKRARTAPSANPNAPYAMPALAFGSKDATVVAEVKQAFGDLFNADTRQYTRRDVENHFQAVVAKGAVLDVPLDAAGQTALHYAATLAAANLVGALVDLGMCLPVRGDNNGEPPLFAAMRVTNAMEKGNFVAMLLGWLWPALWLFDSHHRSFLHVLAAQAHRNYKCAKFYLDAVVQWLAAASTRGCNITALKSVVDAQDTTDGNTALHIAGEHELKWFVYVLLEVGADPTVANATGVRPRDFDCVRHVLDLRDAYRKNRASPGAARALLAALDADDADEYMIELLRSALELLRRMARFPDAGDIEIDTSIGETTAGEKAGGSDADTESKDNGHAEPKNDAAVKTDASTATADESKTDASLLSTRIFQSIQDLLHNTNTEYDAVVRQKRTEINELHRELREATIVTANNRYVLRKIAQRIAHVDTMKLQMSNIADKLNMLRKDIGDLGAMDDALFADDAALKFDADEPFIIRPLYDKLAVGASPDPTPEVIAALPAADVLRARLKAYQEVNNSLQTELDSLLDYSALTAKFKKVVSFCTGVDITEVDELLDGLLDAVEGQQ